MRMIDKVTNLGIEGILGLTTWFLTSGLVLPVIAQVTSDGTTNTQIRANGHNFTIFDGIARGNNLFHSFSKFAVPTSGAATFDLVNTPNVKTIFSRVTGGEISQIDGLINTINTHHPVSLFLINPAGIVFGQNARLDIGGSFIGTTANSIKFADGVEFSAVNSSGTPLLTMSVPVGLQMGQNPGTIRVEGKGHQLSFDYERFPQFHPPFKREAHPTGLNVKPGRTFALVGGDIIFTGGQILAEKGRIELGSGQSGLVSLSPASSGFALGYQDISQFQDIHLGQQALVDASGADGDGINLVGRHITIADGSVALIHNSETTTGGKINVYASESLKISGIAADGKVQSSLTNETIAAGNTGDITVTTKNLVLEAGGQILTRTFGTGAGGNLTINTTEAIDIVGTATANPLLFSSILAIASSGSFGQAGNLTISTQKLNILDGAFIYAASFSHGAGGDMTIQATESVELAGKDPVFDSPSDINVGSYRYGNGGNLTIDTQRLVVRDGATIRASTIGSGDAGSVTVNASEAVEVRGDSTIEASVNTGSSINSVLGIKANPSGKAGGITINTKNLIVTEGKVTVKNLGQANGGTLKINADSLMVNHQGSLSASTASGEGGNIDLKIKNHLFIGNESLISSAAGSTGNGGNILIDSPVIIGVNNSDIVANAMEGQGGNIQIATQGIFGLKNRSQLTNDSDINASSQFGMNGTVQINHIGVDPSSGLVKLPTNVTDPSQRIARGCAQTSESSFIATGRGGRPINPEQHLYFNYIWSDMRDISASANTDAVNAQLPSSSATVVQAASWHRNAQGEVELVASQSPTQAQLFATCTTVPNSK
jgi:filamentous hemagglutinin family protein